MSFYKYFPLACIKQLSKYSGRNAAKLCHVEHTVAPAFSGIYLYSPGQAQHCELSHPSPLLKDAVRKAPRPRAVAVVAAHPAIVGAGAAWRSIVPMQPAEPACGSVKMQFCWSCDLMGMLDFAV